MITKEFPVDIKLNYPLEQFADISKIAFFDIETTGFAADNTYLYLIGCIYHKNGSFHIIQWFSEDIREEKALITSFFEFLKDYNVLIHYNGSGFDLPYLLKKCHLLELPYSFDSITSIDLYKKISPYKNIFKLNNFKQKSIEDFLGVNRTDTADGGDLIQVYSGYLGKKRIDSLRKSRKVPESDVTSKNALSNAAAEAEELLKLLLLHNEDDLKGLVCICPILYYADIFEKPIHILQAGVEENKLTIRFDISCPLPVRVSFGNDVLYFTAHGRSASLYISVYEGELKHFYDNYKDYYYLPLEDTVVHKSLALFVDKEFREKAKPSNCYTKKQGIFAPLYENLLSPTFKNDYRDKLQFIEIHTDFLLQEENLEKYVNHILYHMLISKS